MNSVALIAIWIVILIGNALYSFLPPEVQRLIWVRTLAILVAVTILLYSSYELINKYRSRIVASVSGEGEVLESKNFPWDIVKIQNNDAVMFLVKEWYIDASQVSVESRDKLIKPVVRSGLDGLVIEFREPIAKVSAFEISFKK